MISVQSINLISNLGPVDGEWSEWGAWSPCTGICGAATKTRTRSCDDPPPSINGQFCVGRSHQTMACSPAGGQCEDTGEWLDVECWISYSHILLSLIGA